MASEIEDIKIVVSTNAKQAAEQIDLLNKEIADTGKVSKKSGAEMDSAFDKVNQNVDSLSNKVGSFKNVIQSGFSVESIQAFAQSMKGAESGVIKTSSAFGKLKLAIAATGIGALVIAVTSLVAWFKRTDEGGMKLEGMMRAVGLITDKLVTAFASLGEWMFKAFSDPKQAMIDIGTFLKDQLMNRVYAIGNAFAGVGKIISGVFSGDSKKAKEGLLELVDAGLQFQTGIVDLRGKLADLGKEMSEAAKFGMQLAEAYDELDSKIRLSALAASEEEIQIAKLMRQSRDRTKTIEERLALIDKAIALEKKSTLAQIEIEKERLRLARLENDQSTRNLGTTEDVIRATEDQNLTLVEQQKLREANLNLTDEELQKETDVVLKINQLRLQSTQLQEKAQNMRNALLEEDEQRRNKAAQDELERIKTIEEARMASLKKQQEYIQAQDDAEFKLLQKKNEYRILNAKDEDEKYKAQINALQDNLTREFDLAEGNQTKIELALQEFTNAKMQLDKSYTEFKRQQEEQNTVDTLDYLNGLVTITSEASNILANIQVIAGTNQAAMADFAKGLAVFQLGIESAIAVSKAIASAKGLTAFDYAVQVAVAVGTVTSALAKAKQLLQGPQKPNAPSLQNSQAEPIKLAEGAIDLKGGIKGVDSIPALLMPGESVMTTRETRDWKPLLTAIRRKQLNPEDITVRGSSPTVILNNDEVVKELRKRPINEIHIDEKGFQRHMINQFTRTQVLNKRYSI